MGLIHLSNVDRVPGPARAGPPHGRHGVGLQLPPYRCRAGVRHGDRHQRRRRRSLWRETCVFLSAGRSRRSAPAARPPRPPRAPKDSRGAGGVRRVAVDTAWAYARVSSDFNPIHLNDRAARFFGLRGAISHGMWSLARSLAQAPRAGHPARHADRDPVPDARCSCRRGSRSGNGRRRARRNAPCATSAQGAFTCTPGGTSRACRLDVHRVHDASSRRLTPLATSTARRLHLVARDEAATATRRRPWSRR